MYIKEVQRKTILNKAKFPPNTYTANPYVGCPHACCYCYAQYMASWQKQKHTEPWGEFLDVKMWSPIPAKDLNNLRGKEVQIGTVCDPYNPYEAQYQRTRHLLEQLVDTGCQVTIVTKSSLVLRDMDLLMGFEKAMVCFSIYTLDEEEKSHMERSDTIEARLRAMQILYEKGIGTACFLAPVFPVLTKIPPIVEAVRFMCDYIMIERLQLRGKEKENIMKWIGATHPELYSLYDEIYRQFNLSYWKQYRDFYADQFTKLGYTFTNNDKMDQRAKPGRPIIINWLYREYIDESMRAVEQ